MRLHHEGTPDADWEEWLRSGKRDRFSRWALAGGSALVLLGSALLLYLAGAVVFWEWFTASLILLVLAYRANHLRLAGLDKLPPTAGKAVADA